MGYGIGSCEQRRGGGGGGAEYQPRFRGSAGSQARGLWLVREAAPEYAPDVDPAGVENDRLLELANEIVILSAHIHAATARLLELVAEFDRLGGWRVDGHRTCAHWLAHHTGLDLGAAREKVRVARALEELPQARS